MSLKEDIDLLKEQFKTHDYQINGNPSDYQDTGLTGKVKENSTKLEGFDNIKKAVWKWMSGLIMAALIAAFTYLFSQIYNGNDPANTHDHNTNVMDNVSKYGRGGKNNINRVGKSDTDGN